MSKKLVKFRVHKAVFLDEKGKPNSPTHLFLNVRNDGTKPITIKKVSSISANSSLKRVKCDQRPLPIELQPGKEWETWTPMITKKDLDPFRNFVLEFVNSKNRTSIELRSTKRYAVPPKGEIPTGK